MSIKLATRPNRAFEFVQENLSNHARRTDFLLQGLRDADPTSLQVSTWHPVFEIGLDDITQGRGPVDPGPPQGWRCLVHNGTTDVLAAATVDTADEAAAARCCLTGGALVEMFVYAVQVAETTYATRDVDAELAAVEVPALHVSALWCRTAAGHLDQFIPYGLVPVDRGLKRFSVYPLEEFTGVLHRLARQPPDPNFDEA